MSEHPKTAADQIVIDISHYQPTPDWEALKRGGTVGVILKATEGQGYVDPTYDARAIAAREHGLFTAAYHFMRPGDQAKHMAFFNAMVEPEPGNRLVLDFEDDELSFAQLEDAARWLLDNTGCEVTVYGSNVLVDACKGKKSPILERTSLWQARYSSSQPDVPVNIWPTWSLWQWTQSGRVDGINGDVDLNRWNGDPADLPGWFDVNAIPSPTPEPEPPEAQNVFITVDAPKGVGIYVNGRKME